MSIAATTYASPTRPLPDVSQVGWPRLDPLALHGIAGEFVTAASPYTEADPVAVLATVLTGFGAIVNRGPHVLAGNDRHPACLFVVIVGATAKGGKGTSASVARSVLEPVDPAFMATRILGGFGSGEAVVDELRDATDDDPGAGDTRLLIMEGEFARVLKVAGRDGSTLSMTMRDAWDGRPLQARSRARVSVASQHHVGVVGHVTIQELQARLSDTETYAGFTNRFGFVCARRSKRDPEGGNVPAEISQEYGRRLGEIVHQVRRFSRIERTPEAKVRWAEIYHQLADDEPGGLLGAIVARDAPQCLRLSLVYALLDGSRAIDLPHVEAGFAMWRYMRDSAAFIFGDKIGDEIADKLLHAIRAAGPKGLDGTAQRNVFGRHVTGARLDAARKTLERLGYITTRTEETGGRPRTVSVPVAPEALQALKGRPTALRAHTAHTAQENDAA